MADEDVADAAVDTDVNSETATETTTEESTATIVENSPEKGDTGKGPVIPDWPDDWRDKLAKGDAKARKRLDRFQSPADVMKSWQALEQKMSSGDVKATLPDDASEDQIAAYRKDNGIPETPDGYLESLPDGLVIGDEDKEQVKSYIERVHGKNADPAVVAESLAWYNDLKENAIAAQSEADKVAKQKNEDALRVEWGGEFRSNINSIMSFLDTAPSADDGTPLKDLMLGARLADGTHMGNHPAMLKWLAQMASDANPAGFVSPGVGLSQVDSVEAEISTIEKTMRTDRNTYNKDQKMQDRYLTLLGAREKLKASV